jgi:folate-dependent phosphoribosylglycinamide formyltransferase PurN
MQPTVRPLVARSATRRTRIALFLSGGGSNAERVIARVRAAPASACEVAVLVTDAPETSRARELGRLYDLPVIEHDIRRFYAEHGEARVSLASPHGLDLRERWTDGLRTRLAPYAVDFAVFAGFVPLTNLTRDLPCLNVHPGDLTYLKDGRRFLVGLHTVPIERAILEGLDELRSSVIQALPYTGGDDMDSGPILGISGPVGIDTGGLDLAELRHEFDARPPVRPKGGYGDRLEMIAKACQETLKEHGDWVVLPPVVEDVADGRFGTDEAGGLWFRLGSTWHPVETVVYAADGSREVLFRSAQEGGRAGS